MKKYKSRRKAQVRIQKERKARSVAGWWADWKPIRTHGVFANSVTSSYKHNGVTKWQ